MQLCSLNPHPTHPTYAYVPTYYNSISYTFSLCFLWGISLGRRGPCAVVIIVQYFVCVLTTMCRVLRHNCAGFFHLMRSGS